MRTFPTLLLILLVPAVRGQEAPRPAPWSSVQLAIGSFLDQRVHLFQSHLAALAPGATFPGRADHNYGPMPTNAGSSFQVGIGMLPFRRADRIGPELRWGLMATGDLSVSAHFSRVDRMPFDTLVSTGSGQTIPLDSVHITSVNIDHHYRLIGAHGALLWRTRGRLALFGGVGLAGGLLYDTHTEVHYRRSAHVEGDGYYAVPDHWPVDPDADRSVLYTNGNGHWLQWHLPFGAEYRLHRSHELWGRLQLYLELVPQMLFVQRPVIGHTMGFGFQHQLGLRLQL